MSYIDVEVPICWVFDYRLATLTKDGDTIQVMKFLLPDGSESPWLALHPKQYADLHADMSTRITAGLEAETRWDTA